MRGLTQRTFKPLCCERRADEYSNERTNEYLTGVYGICRETAIWSPALLVLSDELSLVRQNIRCVWFHVHCPLYEKELRKAIAVIVIELFDSSKLKVSPLKNYLLNILRKL